MTSTHRNTNLTNLTQLKLHLALESWENVLNTEDPDEAYNNLISTITLILNHTCPSKTSRNKVKKVVFCDEEARRLKRNFLEANDRYLLTGRQVDKLRMNACKKSYDLKLRDLRRSFSVNHIMTADNKSKAIWDIINSERNSNKGPRPLIKSLVLEKKELQDPHDIALHFNQFFTTIAEETLRSVVDAPKQPSPTLPNGHVHIVNSRLFEFKPTDELEVTKIIDSMKSKSSAGLDEISSKIVKFCKEELLLPLTYITNLSLSQGSFPARLKTAKVVPLYKRGKRDDMKSYRPISLIPTFSKIIERVVLARLSQHLNDNGLLTKSQHGFVKGRSTLTALVDLVESIIDNLEEGKNVNGIFMDLSKAFDCLGHELILAKLQSLGICGKAHDWFASYLKGRSQVVEISDALNGQTNKVRSSPLAVSRGVPQGSVLGPVIFILFTNDLPSCLIPYGECFMYADDTVILSSDSSVEGLEIDSFIAVNVAVEYCGYNDLVFNEEKTMQLVFGKKDKGFTGLPNLLTMDYTKHLGVTIDANLSWQTHVDTLCGRLSSALFALRRTLAVGNRESARIAYHALFESHMNYGIVLWGSSSCANLERVLLLQKKAMRLMAGLGRRDSCRKTFQDFGILTAVSSYILAAVSSACSRGVPRHAEIHQHNTRFAMNFQLQSHRTALFEKRPAYIGAKFFNALPVDLKRHEYPKLRTHLRKWLSKRPFYTVTEFFSWRDIDFYNF